MFVHRVPGVFHDCLLAVAYRAVLLLLAGGIGMGGGAGFLPGRFSLCSAVWNVSCSDYGIKVPSTMVVQGEESPVVLDWSTQDAATLAAKRGWCRSLISGCGSIGTP